jgi:tetratricopeptide (TPR) repeat protein
MQFIKIIFQQRKIYITLFCLISILLNIQGYAQEEKGFTFGDSLFKKMSVDDLIQIRKYYDSKVDKLRSEEEVSRGEGMKLSESFLGERGEHISNRDKVYIRIAEYYIEESELENDAAVEEYDKKMDKYDRLLALYENGELESEPVIPEYPTYDYSKAINIYKRLLNEYPSSKFASDALYSEAWLLSKMKKDKESRRIYQEVIDKYPDSPFAPESFIQLAEYFFAPRDDKTEDEQVIVELQKAIKLYKKVLKYRDSKRYDEALYKLGWSYYKLAARDPNYYNDAIMYFMKAGSPKQDYKSKCTR